MRYVIRPLDDLVYTLWDMSKTHECFHHQESSCGAVWYETNYGEEMKVRGNGFAVQVSNILGHILPSPLELPEKTIYIGTPRTMRKGHEMRHKSRSACVANTKLITLILARNIFGGIDQHLIAYFLQMRYIACPADDIVKALGNMSETNECLYHQKNSCRAVWYEAEEGNHFQERWEGPSIPSHKTDYDIYHGIKNPTSSKPWRHFHMVDKGIHRYAENH